MTRASSSTSPRLLPLLDAHEALRWLDRGAGGALAFHVMRAKGPRGLKATPAPDAMKRIHVALDAALAAGATRALLWQLDGLARPGEPLAIAGAVAEHRAEAAAAVEALLQGLKGVAAREDL